MDERELITLWKSYDKKLEDSLVLNRKNAEAITTIKVQSIIASMKPLKIVTIIAGIIWVGFLDSLIISLFAIANPIFLLSAGILAVLNKVAIGIYLYQLILIHQIDISEPIVATQEKIARLTASTIWVARLLFLQLPVWTIFYWNERMLTNGTMGLFILQAIVTGIFTLLAIWLFWNINDKNRDKKWFSIIFSGKEWEPIMKSMDLLNQIDAYRNESATATTSL